MLRLRQSVREFSSEPVDENKLDVLKRLVLLAPSAGNLQSYKVFVVKDKGKKEDLAVASFGQDFIIHAPVVFVFVADVKTSSSKYGARGEFYAVQDATIAAAYAQLIAADLGLSTVWVGAFDNKEVLEILGIRGDYIPVAVLPIGYAAEHPSMPKRKDVDKVFVDL